MRKEHQRQRNKFDKYTESTLCDILSTEGKIRAKSLRYLNTKKNKKTNHYPKRNHLIIQGMTTNKESVSTHLNVSKKQPFEEEKIQKKNSRI